MTYQTNPIVEAVARALIAGDDCDGTEKLPCRRDGKDCICTARARAAHIAGIKALMENVTPEVLRAADYPGLGVDGAKVVLDRILTAHMEQMK